MRCLLAVRKLSLPQEVLFLELFCMFLCCVPVKRGWVRCWIIDEPLIYSSSASQRLFFPGLFCSNVPCRLSFGFRHSVSLQCCSFRSSAELNDDSTPVCLLFLINLFLLPASASPASHFLPFCAVWKEKKEGKQWRGLDWGAEEEEEEEVLVWWSELTASCWMRKPAASWANISEHSSSSNGWATWRSCFLPWRG